MVSAARARRLGTRLAAAVLLALAATGCGGTTTADDEREEQTMTQDEASAELASRPRAAAAEAAYADLLEDVRTALGDLAPDVAWETTRPATTGESLCGGALGDVPGGVRRTLSTGGVGAIPDADWGSVVDTVLAVVRPAGFDESKVVADGPGRHSVSFYGPHDAELVVAGQANTSLTLLGGCFLDPAPGG